MSHPTRGAWIEMQSAEELLQLLGCRTPHGVRGLKCGVTQMGHALTPCRTPHGVRGLKSVRIDTVYSHKPRRTPHGVRGLK